MTDERPALAVDLCVAQLGATAGLVGAARLIHQPDSVDLIADTPLR